MFGFVFIFGLVSGLLCYYFCYFGFISVILNRFAYFVDSERKAPNSMGLFLGSVYLCLGLF